MAKKISSSSDLSAQAQAPPSGRTEVTPDSTSSAAPQNPPQIMQIDGVIYDVSSFVKQHPGGSVILRYAGKDATEVFHALHDRSDKAKTWLRSLPKVNKTVELPQKPFTENQINFLGEIRNVRKTLHDKGYYQPSEIVFYLRTALVLFWLYLGFAVCSSWTIFGAYRFIIAGLIAGFGWAQCGFLMHDTGHISSLATRTKNIYAINFLLGFIQGGSASWWMRRHNHHHISTNEAGKDPDLQTTPLFAWHDDLAKKSPSLLLKIQAYSFWPALTLYMWFWRYATLRFPLKTRNNRELTLIALHYVAVFSLWYYYDFSPKDCWIFYCSAAASKGVILGTIFALNHFALPLCKPDNNMTFPELVSDSTQNIVGGGIVYSLLTGFLNYQIEHHIFPQLPSYHYPALQPQVKAIFKKYNIPYHETTFWKAIRDLTGILFEVAQRRLKALSLRSSTITSSPSTHHDN